MSTVERIHKRGPGGVSAREECRNRFQFSVLDIALLLAVHAVVINGVQELYRGWGTERDYRGGLRNIRIESGKIGKMPLSIPPEPPPAPVVTVIGGRGFTAFWLRRFTTCVIVGSLVLLISFFGTALVLKNTGPHARRAVPRLATSFTCLFYLGALSWLNYIQHNPESYIEIHGRQIHPAIHAAWWAMGPAAVVTCVIAGLEIASYLNSARSRTGSVTG